MLDVITQTDRADLRAALDGLEAFGGTATGDALQHALDQLEARKGRDGKRAPAAIVLLSDGKETVPADPTEERGAFTADGFQRFETVGRSV